MRQWLTHDVLAAEMFNVGYRSGKTGALIAWQAELTNLSNNDLVPWLVDFLHSVGGQVFCLLCQLPHQLPFLTPTGKLGTAAFFYPS